MPNLLGALPKVRVFPKRLTSTETTEEKADKHVCIVEVKNSAVTEDIQKNVTTQKSKLGLKTWKPENTSRFLDGRHFRKAGDIQDGSRGAKSRASSHCFGNVRCYKFVLKEIQT